MKIFQMDLKIKLLCLVYFMVAQSSMMARATSDSFLLKYFQVESIPLMIMAAASLSIVLAVFTTYLCGRFQAFGAMRIATAGLVISLVGIIALVFYLGKSGENKIIYVLAYMLCEVIVILPMVLFWGMAVGVLNPTESKKWLGLIGAAGTCGCILAGYTISFVSEQEYVNELSLGMVAGVLLVVSFILVVRAKLLTIDDDEAIPSAQSASIIRKLAVLISSRQSVLMTGLVVFSAVVLSLIDINFKFEVREFYSNKSRGELYDFFGQFYTYTSIAQLILQLLVVRAVLTRGGVWAAISILPVLLLLTSIFALVVGDRNAVYVSKFITQVVFFTIEYVGLQMLFLSVTKKMRGQMNSAVDGLTRPATIASISLLITYTLPFWQEDTVFRLNSIIICLCVFWLIVSFLNYRQYISSLIDNLKARISKGKREPVLTEQDRHELERVLPGSQTGSQRGKEEISPELIEEELSQIDYGTAPIRYAELVAARINCGKELSVKDLKSILNVVSDASDRAALLLAFFDSAKLDNPSAELRKFGKSRLLMAMNECSLMLELAKLFPRSEKLRPLRQALDDQLKLRQKVLVSILPTQNKEIDFPKLMKTLTSQRADAKAEALEVLKGVLKPSLADDFVSLFNSSDGDGDSDDFTSSPMKSIAKLDCRWLLQGFLLSVDEDDFAKHEELMDQFLSNEDELVRKTALEVYIRLQGREELVLEKCRAFTEDASPVVCKLAQDRLAAT